MDTEYCLSLRGNELLVSLSDPMRKVDSQLGRVYVISYLYVVIALVMSFFSVSLGLHFIFWTLCFVG